MKRHHLLVLIVLIVVIFTLESLVLGYAVNRFSCQRSNTTRVDINEMAGVLKAFALSAARVRRAASGRDVSLAAKALDRAAAQAYELEASQVKPLPLLGCQAVVPGTR